MFMVSITSVVAQQDAQFTQSALNPNIVNPAFAASRNALNISLLHRTQWMNIDGRPITQTLSVSSPLKNEKLAVGINLLNDKIGPSQEVYANVDLAYTIIMRDYRQFSFGVKAGAHLLNVNFSKLNIQSPNDTKLLSNINNKIIPQIGVGLLYQSEKHYLGLSIPDLLETKHYDNSSKTFIAKERMNVYLCGGYLFEWSDAVKFQPSFQSKAVMGSPLQVDVAGNFLWNDRFSLGAAYRWSSAVSGLVSYRIIPDLVVGVAYDYELTDVAQLTPGSYEFIIKYDNLSKGNKRLLNPRFF